MTFDKTYLLIETNNETGEQLIIDTFNFYPEALKFKKKREAVLNFIPFSQYLPRLTYSIEEDKPLVTSNQPAYA